MNSSFCTSIPSLNYTSCERIDPIFSLITGAAWNPALYLQYQLAVFALGLLCCLYQRKQSRFAPLSSVALTLFASIFLLGSEPLYYTAFWFPLFLGSLERCATNRSATSLLAAIASGLLLIWNVGAIAVLTLFIAMLFLLWRHVTLARPTVALLFLLGLVALLQLPQSPFPHYPPGARVSPLSPLTISQPIVLAGPELRFNPLLFGPYESAAKMFSLSTAVLGCLLLFATIISGTGARSLIPLATLCALCAGEFLFNSSIYFSPFQTLRRVIPGLGIVLIPWSLALPLVVPSFIEIGAQFSARLLAGLAVAVLLIFMLQVGVLSPRLRPAMLSVSARASDTRTHGENIAFSPSSFVAKEAGAWSINPGLAAERGSARLLGQPQDFVWTASSSAGSDKVLLALDGKDASRWSTGHPQKPGDSFTITFDRAVELIKVELSVRNTPTDFPRGFRVEGSLEGNSFTTIISFKDWHGPLRWTDSDFPYFGPPHDVSIQFPATTRVKILRFVLIAGDPQFDWSIGELRVYAPAKGSESPIAESVAD